MKQWSEEEYYSVRSMGRLYIYRAKGVTFTTLLKKAGISLSERQEICVRTNTWNHYGENDEVDGILAYEKIYTYEELTRKRYRLNGLYQHEIFNNWNFNLADDEVRSTLGSCEKQIVEPMFAYITGYNEARLVGNLEHIGYNKYTETDTAFSFLTGMNMDEENTSMIANENNDVIEHVFGLDIVYQKNPSMNNTDVEKLGNSGYVIDISNYRDYWEKSITEVLVDGTPISTEQYTLRRLSDGNDGYLYLSAEVFGSQTKREQDYEICIKAKGYEDVTGTLTMTSYAAQSFTVRLVTAEGKVEETVTLSMDEIRELIEDTEQRYTIFDGYSITDYKAVGLTFNVIKLR
jgi:hypothetical protein